MRSWLVQPKSVRSLSHLNLGRSARNGLRVPAEARVDVGVVDSGGGNPNEHFVRPDSRHGHVIAHLELVEAAMAREQNGSHPFRNSCACLGHCGMIVPAFMIPFGSNACLSFSSIPKDDPYSSRTQGARALPMPWWWTIEPPRRNVSSQMIEMIGR